MAAGAVLEPASYEIAIAARTIPAGQNAIRLQIGDRDYLKDSDGDGAGDINERLEATDPADPDSAPDDPVIDVLILYSQSVPALYDGDPVTDDFGTIMTYGPRNGTWTRLDVFSNPPNQCIGSQRQSTPCGVNREAVDGDNAAHRVASVGDLDGDAYADIVLSSSLARVDGGRTRGAAYVISVADFAAADAGDGLSDHVIDLGHVAAQPGSWKLFNGAYADWIYRLVSSAEKPDSPSRWLLVGNHLMSWEDLAGADAKDGVLDGTVDLLRLTLERLSVFNCRSCRRRRP